MQNCIRKNRGKAAALKQKKADDNFYQKLSDGFDATALVVGDSIGAVLAQKQMGSSGLNSYKHI